MTNKELFKASKDEAYSCDVMIGWTCNFCRNIKAKLQQALKGE